MNFACESCQRRYSIPDEKVRGKTVRVRCKNCQSPITLRGDRLEAAAPAAERVVEQPVGSRPTYTGKGAPTAAAEAPTPAAPQPVAEWFVMLKGQQTGPLTEDALCGHVKTGEVTPRSFFWRKGMADWKRGSDVPELAALLAGERPSRPKVPSAPAARPPMEELFSDALLKGGEADFSHRPAEASPSEPSEERPVVAARSDKKKRKATPEPAYDPFVALGDIDPDKLPPPGEATQFFIAQAGVNKRNPPWKIALFVSAWIVVPGVLIFLLTSLEVVPLEVTRIDESGKEVTESVFSHGVVSGIGSLLSGQTIRAKKEAERVRETLQKNPRPVAKKEPASGATRPGSTTAAPEGVDLAAFYGEKKDRGPTLRKGVEVKQKEGQVGGPEAEAVAKVVAATQPAFQFCVEQELKKNPSFRGGKIMLTAVIGGSGVVKSTRIDRRDIDTSQLGECLKGKAKRMMFGSFQGEELEIEFPLILTSAM